MCLGLVVSLGFRLEFGTLRRSGCYGDVSAQHLTVAAIVCVLLKVTCVLCGVL